MSVQDSSPITMPFVVAEHAVNDTRQTDTTTSATGEQSVTSLRSESVPGDGAGCALAKALDGHAERTDGARDETDEMAERHHQAGFSAEAFESYEKRLNTSLKQPEPVRPKSAVLTPSTESFDTAVDLEKGLSVSDANKNSSWNQVVHGKHGSTGTFDTLGTLASDPDGNGEVLTVPEKRQHKVVRNLRHTYLNVYRRLFTVAFIGNIIPMIVWLAHLRNESINSLNLTDLATAAAVNFAVAILIRQDYIVNFLYRVCWLVPHSTPLRIRRSLAKVYENGGVHSGCAVAGFIWFLVLTIVLSFQFANFVLRSVPVLTLTCVLLAMLFAIILLAYPKYRFFSHNTFEYTHRFAGWTAIAIFWADAMLIVHEIQKKTGRSFGRELVRLPVFWILIIITAHLVLPWLRLRKWRFNADQLSTHAVRLDFEKTLPPLSGLAIAEAPLGEWHPFATYPREGGGGSMIISNAGDWTKRTILGPKSHYWVKGMPKTGVLSMAFVFRKVVVVTTGSGIGPCLSFLLEPRRKTVCRVLWSTPSPMQTYGRELCQQVQSCDPEAMIIDTRQRKGRPDMVGLTYKLFKESGAEAVFCISNPRLTRKIVYGMESRGVPAFGPIWDS
ncbi:uncharacterized protein PV09_00543 [Verruconis gallopava]|uniref:AMP-dependent synthetase/ligase domain-containing protein n=1 Tax=Verruconis gallopava TaxID=253628 RepID=A0A0D2BBB7_9PEZI|nr:uncharacterized protein PV09_00543 [Verruconis gallopava]KIW08579.1 hypothetical protein PV09_00543 [Verruconis gallopava]